MTVTAKITPTRAAAVSNFLREARGEKVPYQGRSNSRFRMFEAMRDEGLWGKYESERALAKDQPRKPKLLQDGPTAKMLRAFIEQGYAAPDAPYYQKVREQIEARIVDLCEAESLYERAMEAYRDQRQRLMEARAKERRAMRAVAFREFFAEEKIDLGDRTEDEMLALVERLVEKEMAL